ncbi:hypothetical protein CDAR_544481 [Caerostris darwini]|uniref:Uncharacterized protein n=1 Tax=Caerostris darwini TaxID=1538125 RepID=A0AAV4THU6_9ARAC|nr:hypothetical protein CDAR_544481 [Caerostris darwini]
MRAIFHLPFPVRAMAFQKKKNRSPELRDRKTEIGEGPPLRNMERVSLTVDSCLEHCEFVFHFVVSPPCTPGKVPIKTEKKDIKWKENGRKIAWER